MFWQEGLMLWRMFTVGNSVDVDSSGSYVCADQKPHLFPLKTGDEHWSESLLL